MKKVLKLILVLTMLAALTVSALADVVSEAGSPTVSNVDTSNLPAGSDVIGVTTDANDEYRIVIGPATEAGEKANKDAAAKAANDAGATTVAPLDSFDIKVYKGDVQVHDGITVNVTYSIPEKYTDGSYFFTLVEDGKVLGNSVKIEGDTYVAALTSFSEYTAVVTNVALKGAQSPVNGQNFLPYALMAVAVLAVFGMVFAGKRRFN